MGDERMNVAVVGATGAVGEAMISVLEERDFPLARLYPLASRRSAGRRVAYRGRAHRVEALEEFEFSKVGIALFSAGAAVAGEHAPRAAAAGCAVVDNSSRFRYEPDVPLVVPEVNPEPSRASGNDASSPIRTARRSRWWWRSNPCTTRSE